MKICLLVKSSCGCAWAALLVVMRNTRGLEIVYVTGIAGYVLLVKVAIQ